MASNSTLQLFVRQALRCTALLLLATQSQWATATLVSATLPSSRSVQVNSPATFFGTMINAGTQSLNDCEVKLTNPFPGTFSYQTTDPATNQPSGSPDTPVAVGAGEAQSFVLTLTATAPVSERDIPFEFVCAGSAPALSIPGLNTLLFSATESASADVIALAAADAGVAHLATSTGLGAFAVATVNVGAADTVQVTADTGTAKLPVDVLLCQTNAAAECINPAVPSTAAVSVSMAASSTATFSVFPSTTEEIPFDPANNRVFVRFKDGAGNTRGSTSVAAEMPRHVGSSDSPARVSRRNLPQFAKVLNYFIINATQNPSNLVQEIFQSEIPSLNLANGTTTDTCGNGTRDRTVSNNGANVVIVYTNCQLAYDHSSNGQVRLAFSNINPATASYDVQFSYDDFTVEEADGTVHTYSGGSQTTVTLIEEDYDTFSLHAGTTSFRRSSSTGRTFEAVDLAFNIERYRYGSSMEILAVDGRISIDSEGYLDVTTSPLDVEPTVLNLVGMPGTTQSMSLNREKMVLELDAAGDLNYRSVSESWVLQNGEFTLDSNTAPQFNYYYGGTRNVGESFVFRASDAFIDYDGDFLTASIVVALGNPDKLDLQQITSDSYEITPSATGNYQLSVSVRDPNGNSTNATITVEVDGDTDGDGQRDRYDNDDDNDGVPDSEDAFPLDASESRDTDGDGQGDNADPDDDNDGVLDSDDAFPLDPDCSSITDSSCALRSMGRFDHLITAGDTRAYFIVNAEKRIFEWDLTTNTLSQVIEVGTSVPSDSVLAAAAWVPVHNRLYLGYNNGAITYVVGGETTEVYLTAMSNEPRSMGDAGNFLIVHEGRYNGGSRLINPSGVITDTDDRSYTSETLAFNAVNNRVYHFQDGLSPNDLRWQTIDQATGTFADTGESPYHGDYTIAPPIVISHAGDKVLIGGGSIYNSDNLTWLGAIPGGIVAAHWSAAHGIVALRASDEDTPANGDTFLTNRNDTLSILDERTFTGAPRGLLPTPTGYLVITETAEGLISEAYTPDPDSDGDGVDFTVDAFPTDPAASKDTDRDGAPDEWNPGYTGDDSTLGLVLDAFPENSACQLSTDATNGVCDVAGSIDAYMPDHINTSAAGIVYLFSSDARRVYRYDANSGTHLSPFVVGNETRAVRPHVMEYSPNHNRLYFGYDNGDITYIDLSGSSPAELEFSTLSGRIGGLGAAGNHLLAQDPSGAWNSHYIFDINGTLTDSAEWNRYSRDYEWNATLNRIYFFRDQTSPNDLEYEDISAEGLIIADGDSPYHGDYGVAVPILVAPDDASVLLGTGDRFDASSLEWMGSLINSFVDAAWDSTGALRTIRSVGGITRLDAYSTSYAWQGESDYTGAPLALESFSGGMVLVTSISGKPAFQIVP